MAGPNRDDPEIDLEGLSEEDVLALINARRSSAPATGQHRGDRDDRPATPGTPAPPSVPIGSLAWFDEQIARMQRSIDEAEATLPSLKLGAQRARTEESIASARTEINKLVALRQSQLRSEQAARKGTPNTEVVGPRGVPTGHYDEAGTYRDYSNAEVQLAMRQLRAAGKLPAEELDPMVIYQQSQVNAREAANRAMQKYIADQTAQISRGKIDADTARQNFDAYLENLKWASPNGSPYLPGYEPGGFVGGYRKIGGRDFDPEQYRIQYGPANPFQAAQQMGTPNMTYQMGNPYGGASNGTPGPVAGAAGSQGAFQQAQFLSPEEAQARYQQQQGG